MLVATTGRYWLWLLLRNHRSIIEAVFLINALLTSGILELIWVVIQAKPGPKQSWCDTLTSVRISGLELRV